VLGVGAAANAAGLVPTPSFLPWSQTTLSSGTTCEITYGAVPQVELARARSLSPAEQAAALKAAQKFLRDFDLSTISVKDAIKKSNAADKKYRTSHQYLDLPLDERPPRETPDEVELGAVSAELYERLSIQLKRQGLDPEAVSMAAGNRCSDDRSGQ